MCGAKDGLTMNPYFSSGLLQKSRKLMRFMAIYGPRRALIKAMGRLRIGRLPFRGGGHVEVGLIGCGQFAFSTIAYFLRGTIHLQCAFDPDRDAAATLVRTFGGVRVCETANEVLEDSRITCIYIASNHASHTPYAIAALAAGKVVYVEKPVAVSHAQLAQLRAAIDKHKGHIHAGYNRPFATAIRDLKLSLPRPRGPLSMACFVSGHVIPLDHWYRDEREGTRICGNVGHWLDLAVHIVSWRALPDEWTLTVCSSNPRGRDDDLSITLVSSEGDLINIVMTSRTEPFEGIIENINIQWGDVIARIDDFRRMTLWQGERVMTKTYWPKDVGHKLAVQQPFAAQVRPWREVEDSTLLMLRIADMVKSGEVSTIFSFLHERNVHLAPADDAAIVA